MAGDNDPWKLVGTEFAGRYRVEQSVEEGGFGVIYRGEHTALKKPVAVKVLKTPDEFSPQVREAFVQNFTLEAQTIARMSHPHIVQVLDFGVSDMPSGHRAPWMVMEWLDGKPLSKFLKARGGQPYAPREALELIKPVIEALAYAHELQIAHRDIKPANIMMLETRRGPFPKLLDFGIAKVMTEGEEAGSGHTVTKSATLAFSPRYAAPEQIAQARTGPWTDVHAIGLIVTELLIGRTPVDAPGGDTTRLFSQILSPDRPTPRMRGFDAGAWEPVLQKAMALSPQDRYRDAGELLAALQADVPAAIRGLGAGDPWANVPPPPGGVSMPPGAPTHQTTISGSVSVMNTAARPAPSGGSKLATMLVVLAALVIGVGGGVLVVTRSRSASPSPAAAAPAPAPTRAGTTEPAPGNTPQAPSTTATAPPAATATAPTAPTPPVAPPTTPVAPQGATTATPTTPAAQTTATATTTQTAGTGTTEPAAQGGANTTRRNRNGARPRTGPGGLGFSVE